MHDLDSINALFGDAVTVADGRVTVTRPDALAAAPMDQLVRAAVFAEGRRLDVRHVRDADGRLVALLPLYEIEPDTFELLGGAEVSDYLDLIVVAGHEEDAWAALLAARAGERARWVLHAVPAASATVRAGPYTPLTLPANKRV